VPVKSLARPATIAFALIVTVAVIYYVFVRVAPTPGPSSVATKSTSCDAGTNDVSIFESRVPVAAWMLGAREGAHAGWLKQLTDGEVVREASGMEEWLTLSRKQAASASTSADRMATTLGVQRPAVFAPPHGREAIDAFQAWVEAADQPTARGLAATYAPWVCHLYKLGTYWGFSMLYRTAARNHANVFDGEIRHYADLVSLPQNLLDRMTTPASADLNDGQVVADSEGISRAIADYWAQWKGRAPVER
jgi:hypothetical protein